MALPRLNSLSCQLKQVIGDPWRHMFLPTNMLLQKTAKQIGNGKHHLSGFFQCLSQIWHAWQSVLESKELTAHSFMTGHFSTRTALASPTGRALGNQSLTSAPVLTWLLWISIDPRSGQIIPYPKEARGCGQRKEGGCCLQVSKLLEAAHERGDASVSLGSRHHAAQGKQWVWCATIRTGAFFAGLGKRIEILQHCQVANPADSLTPTWSWVLHRCSEQADE